MRCNTSCCVDSSTNSTTNSGSTCVPVVFVPASGSFILLQSNLRFNAAKESVLEALPEPATAREKEEALSTFHKQWLNLEKARTDVYTQEWRSKNWQVIKLAARVELQNIQKRISGVFGSNSNDR